MFRPNTYNSIEMRNAKEKINNICNKENSTDMIIKENKNRLCVYR